MEGALKQLRWWCVTLPLAATPLFAQQSITVPASSAVYERLEAVSAWYPARGIFLGERPMSRRDLLRAIRILSAAVDRDSVPSARRDRALQELAAVSAALESRRGARQSGAAVALVAVKPVLASTDAVTDRITPNGLGLIDATTNPFEITAPRAFAGRGTAADVALTAAAGLGDHVAMVLEPRALAVDAPDGAAKTDVQLYRAYARATVHNVALRVGSDEMRWGQSPRGSLFLSGNARPLPALAIGTDTAIVLPWWFRFVGPVRGTVMLADLGRTQDPPHARLAGWQLSLAPWSRFELGVAVLAQTGGNGGPPATFFRRVVDLFPVIDAIAPQHADLQISNKLAGGNLRLRFPELSNLDVYYELQIDDFDARRLRSSFVDDAGHLLGARLPVVTRAGAFVWRGEWQRTSLRLYEHAQFRSGVTYRGRVIGNPLGPHATGGLLSAEWSPSPDRRLQLMVSDESRDPSQYFTTSNNARDEGFRFVRVSDDPRYRRRRVIGAWELPAKGSALTLGLGYNRAWRTGAPARNEWNAQLALRSHLLPTF